MDSEQKQICIMKILLPIESDEKAIAYKKAIEQTLSDIPEATIDFRLIKGKPLPPT